MFESIASKKKRLHEDNAIAYLWDKAFGSMEGNLEKAVDLLDGLSGKLGNRWFFKIGYADLQRRIEGALLAFKRALKHAEGKAHKAVIANVIDVLMDVKQLPLSTPEGEVSAKVEKALARIRPTLEKMQEDDEDEDEEEDEE